MDATLERLEAADRFFAYVQETASHAMCHADTYTLKEALSALYRIHEAGDRYEIERRGPNP